MGSIIECTPGKVLKTYYKKEMWGFEKKWMSVFCKNKQGYNTKAYKWHIFSGGGFPALEGEKAKQEYLKHEAVEYIIMSNDDEFAISTNIRPETCNLSDYYVFPVNMAWTMAFTHEEGWFGPYFAKHPDYETLNNENLQKIEKMNQIELAKKNGWI